MKLKKKYRDYADSVIATMQAFKNGEPIQLKGRLRTNGKWQDFDLRTLIDNGPIHYRVKPKRK